MKQFVWIRQSILASVVLLAALFVLPLAVITPRPARTELRTERENGEAQEIPLSERTGDPERMIRVMHQGQIETMPFSAYLIGVLRAEMPASFEPEALKAQAVAARTYTLYKMTGEGNHGSEADICTEPSCCQAYTDRETAWTNWGSHAETYEEKIHHAVEETKEQVLLYDGEPILAVFHAASSGITRPADAVWSQNLPYLQPVSSPEPKDSIPNYYSRLEFSTETFCAMVCEAYGNAHFGGDKGQWIIDAVTDKAGNVEKITVGGIRMKGAALRNLLGLRSACFTWEMKETSVVFYVTGYGHGVGLSQYGANQMAKEGADWREILFHYYTDVSIGPYRFTNAART